MRFHGPLATTTLLLVASFAWHGTANADLSNLAGRWDYFERISLHCVIEGEVLDETQSGSGEVVVQQNGSTISWNVPQLNLTRTATLDGYALSFGGPFAVPLVPDVTFTTNSATGTGTVAPQTERIDFTGSGTAAGTACVEGMCGSFSCTGTSQGTFRRPLLTVQKTGACGGTVTSAPTGVSCGADCAEGFAKGGQVTFSATSDAGAVFGGWSGPCTGIGSCTVTANTSTTVGARFDCASPLAAAVLPGSRAVQVSHAATAFATILNSGASTATGCSITPTNAPAGTTFSYQQTNAANVPIGAPNTPADIPGGGSQSFVFSLTPSQPFPATELHFNFDCTNTTSAPDTPGVNTFLLTSSSSPIPDIVALAAAVGGIVSIPGPTGTGAFATATVNVGASAPITVTADTGSASLPVVLTICQTNPTTGACFNPPSPAASVAAQIDAFQTPTFAVFVRGTGNVPFSPGVNRAFVRFKTASGATVGATSVAIRTQ